MKHIASVYSNVREAMKGHLSSLGFEVFRDEDNGPFGSRYTELHCGIEAIRFIWDGKEAWFPLGDVLRS